MSSPLIPVLIVQPNGTRHEEKLTPDQHTRLYLEALHRDRDHGLIEVAYADRAPGKKPVWESRSDPERYPHITETDRIVHLVSAGRAAGKEVCLGVVLRTETKGTREAAGDSHLVWIDIDRPGELHRLWAWSCPPHALASSGRGGVHAFWRLTSPLPALPREQKYVERANLRLDYQLAGDIQVRHRNCLLRAPGSINHKIGNWCHLLFADLHRPPYDARALVGSLPDPPPEFTGGSSVRRLPRRTRRYAANLHDEDPARHIAPHDYFRVLTNRDPGEYRFIQCPNPAHKGGQERTPSCEVYDTPEEGWYCWGCGAGGSIYDLAAVMLGIGCGSAITREVMREIVGPHVERAFGIAPYAQRTAHQRTTQRQMTSRKRAKSSREHAQQDRQAVGGRTRAPATR